MTDKIDSSTRQSLRDRLVELFATEFVVSRAGSGDPNEAAAGRAIEAVAAWLRNEAAELRQIAAADTDEDRQRIRHFIAAYESLADSISPQGEQQGERIMTVDLDAIGERYRLLRSADELAPDVLDDVEALVAEVGRLRAALAPETPIAEWERMFLDLTTAAEERAEARGYRKAIEALRDVAGYKRWHAEQLATTGVDHHRFHATARSVLGDYLESLASPNGDGDA